MLISFGVLPKPVLIIVGGGKIQLAWSEGEFDGFNVGAPFAIPLSGRKRAMNHNATEPSASHARGLGWARSIISFYTQNASKSISAYGNFGQNLLSG